MFTTLDDVTIENLKSKGIRWVLTLEYFRNGQLLREHYRPDLKAVPDEVYYFISDYDRKALRVEHIKARTHTGCDTRQCLITL